MPVRLIIRAMALFSLVFLGLLAHHPGLIHNLATKKRGRKGTAMRKSSAWAKSVTTHDFGMVLAHTHTHTHTHHITG
jgi:hypothetical protein